MLGHENDLRRGPHEPAYFREVRCKPFLTRDHESNIFRRIDDGQRRALEAITRSTVALAEVLALGSGLRQQRVRYSELSRAFRSDDHGADHSEIAAEMLSHFDKLQELFQRRGPTGAEDVIPGEMLKHLDALCLDTHQLVRIADLVENRAAQRGEAADDDAGDCHEGIVGEMRLGVRSAVRARHELVECCLRLVISVARRYQYAGVELMDLIQEGNIGLLTAADKFDIRRGYRFTTYAYWWISRAIRRAITCKSRIVRLPVHLQEQIRRMNHVRRSLARSRGRDPESSEIAQALEVPIETVRNLLTTQSACFVSLEAPVSGDDCFCLGDVTKDDDSLSPFDALHQRSMEVHVEEALTALSPREERVLRRRFGIGSEDEQTLAELGREFSLSRERIRQIQSTALARLRRSRGALFESVDSK